MATDTRMEWKVLLEDDDWEGVWAEAQGEEARQGHLRSGRFSRSALNWALPSILLLLTGLFFLTGWGAIERQTDDLQLSFAPAPSADRLAARGRGESLTEHLRIRAFGADVAVAAGVAAQLEALYVDAFATLGISPIHGQGAQDGRIFVSVEGVRRPVWDGERGWVSLPSPTRLPASAQTSRQLLLRQTWIATLVPWATQEAVEIYQIPAGWLPLLEGLRVWMLRDAGGPLAEGWAAAAAHLYAPKRDPIPATDSESLCQRYTFWELTSIGLNILLGCGPLKGSPQQVLPMTTQLAALALPEEFWNSSAQAYALPGEMEIGRKVALALLIEYALNKHGRERLPTLLAALREHNNWETLIPAVFGVPAEEFEAGWREWLVEIYGEAPE